MLRDAWNWFEKLKGKTMVKVKLYSITRRDISPGYQAVQSSHAVADLVFTMSDEVYDWKENSNTMIQLSTNDESDLRKLFFRVQAEGFHPVAFLEPDIGNQLTAIAFIGDRKICHKLKDEFSLQMMLSGL